MALAVSYHAALKVLDLLPSASSADAEAAYRDLIKVWHPDRFPTDERLRARAEEKTKQLNEAMAIIRALSKIERVTPDHTSSPPQPDASSPRRHEQSQPRSSGSSEHRTAPLNVHRRLRSSLLYLLASAALFAVCFTTLLRPGLSAHTGAFAVSVAFWAMREMIKQCFVGILNVPILFMNRNGIYIFSHGWFAWSELQEIESRLQQGAEVIAVRLSKNGLAAITLLRRLVLKLRSPILRAHYIVPFSDLTVSPSAVVMLAREHFAHSTTSSTPTGRRGSMFWFSAVEYTAITLAIGLYLFGREPHPLEALPYFAIAAGCQTVRLACERPKRS